MYKMFQDKSKSITPRNNQTEKRKRVNEMLNKIIIEKSFYNLFGR